MESYKSLFTHAPDWNEELNLNTYDFSLELTPANSAAWGIRLRCEKSFDDDHRSTVQIELLKEAGKNHLVVQEAGTKSSEFMSGYNGETFTVGIKRSGAVAVLTFFGHPERQIELGDFSVITITAIDGSPDFRIDAVITRFPKKTILNQELT